MRRSTTLPLVLLAFALLAAALIAGPATVAGAEPAPPDDGDPFITIRGAQTPDEDKRLREFWTRERRASATPPEPESLPEIQTPSAAPAQLENRMEPNAPLRDLLPPLSDRGLRVEPSPPLTAEGAVPTPPTQPGTDPVPWPVSLTGTSAPSAQMGALYYVDTGGRTRVCSATAVNSPTRNVLLTAASCLAPAGGGADGPVNTGFVFTRLWKSLDETPKEETYTSSFATFPREWATGTRPTATAYDIGALVMNTGPTGQHIVDALGGQGLLTYPAEVREYTQFEWHYSPTNLKLHYCKGTSTVGQVAGAPNASPVLPCTWPGDPTTGYIGGPWLADYDPATGKGYVAAVTSFGTRLPKDDGTEPKIKVAPYFGWVAERLYNSVANAGPNDLWIPFGQSKELMTGFSVQNLHPKLSTTVRIDYLNDAGVATSITRTIGAGSTTEPLIDDGPADTTAVHVARTESTGVRIASAVNHLIPKQKLGSTTASTGGSNDVLAPLLMQDNYGTSTRLMVQNTEGREQDVTIQYLSPDQTFSPITVQNIPAHSSRTLNQALGDLPQVFSARVTAPGNVAIAVTEESVREQLEYEGLPYDTSRNRRLALPIVVANNFGGFTGIAVQNPSDKDVLVTLKYLPNKAELIRDDQGRLLPDQPPICPGSPASFTIPTKIPPNGGANILHNRRVPDLPPGGNPIYFDEQFNPQGRPACRYVGGAFLEADAPVVAIVNQAGAGGSAIPAVNPAFATSSADLPLVQTNNSQTLTGIQIMNLGFDELNARFTFTGNFAENAGAPAKCPGPLTRADLAVATNNSETVLVGNHQQADPKVGCRYVGGARITGQKGSRFAVVVNQTNNDGTPDPLSSYLAPYGQLGDPDPAAG
jgi:hypothetical protein